MERPSITSRFSYPELDPVFNRMTRAGVEIVRPIPVDPNHGHRSFFVRGPDRLLVEIVEARPIPEGLWHGVE
jgi:catechol 2,3-dioxygenase-like lactoylglutathione lyase family enzyme